MNNTISKASNRLSNYPTGNSSGNSLPTVITNAATNAVNATANAANQAMNATTNAFQKAAQTVNQTYESAIKPSLFSPVQESLNASFESNTSPYVSIPIILGLGILIIALVVLISFRESISLALELSWRKIKSWFHSAEKSVGHAMEPSPSSSPSVDHAALQRMLPSKKEVFNVADNKYKYSDAEPLCKALGAELATYEQVKEAWKQGADWCNYGWVKGQSAVYPTQASTYDALQTGPEDQRMSCGVTGVNGGYFDNPELRFGVNCYGARPSHNDADDRHAAHKNKSEGALEYDRKVQEYKNHKDQIPVNPFRATHD